MSLVRPVNRVTKRLEAAEAVLQHREQDAIRAQQHVSGLTTTLKNLAEKIESAEQLLLTPETPENVAQLAELKKQLIDLKTEQTVKSQELGSAEVNAETELAFVASQKEAVALIRQELATRKALYDQSLKRHLRMCKRRHIPDSRLGGKK